MSLLPVLAVAFAALCVWLGVRIINRRERWAKWTLAVVIALPVLYVASFGPACWMVDEGQARTATVAWIYAPLVRIACGKGPCARPLARFSEWNRRPGSGGAISVIRVMRMYPPLYDGDSKKAASDSTFSN